MKNMTRNFGMNNLIQLFFFLVYTGVTPDYMLISRIDLTPCLSFTKVVAIDEGAAVRISLQVSIPSLNQQVHTLFIIWSNIFAQSSQLQITSVNWRHFTILMLHLQLVDSLNGRIVTYSEKVVKWPRFANTMSPMFTTQGPTSIIVT